MDAYKMREVFLKSSKKKRDIKGTVEKNDIMDKGRGNCEVFEIAGKGLFFF